MIPLPETLSYVPDKSVQVLPAFVLYCTFVIEPEPFVEPHVKVTDALFNPITATTLVGAFGGLYGVTEFEDDDASEYPPRLVYSLNTTE